MIVRMYNNKVHNTDNNLFGGHALLADKPADAQSTYMPKDNIVTTA